MSGPAAFDRHTVRVSSSILCAFFFVAIASAVRTVTAAQAGAASTEVAPSVLASGAPNEAVPAAQAGFCPFVVRASAQDIATGLPIPLVGYRLFRLDHSKERETPSATAQSDDEGTALFRDICPGSYEIEASHVGYESSRRALRIPASAGGAAPDTIRVELRLQAKVFQVEEVDVHAETVAPAADLERGSLAVPRAATELFVGHDLVDAVAVVPGVLVTGERIYFRGLEQTHVTATIDGIPAVDPISGRWILPPPQSLTGAEVVASAMVSEAVPAIGGLLSMRLASGEGPFRAKVVYGSDRVGSFPSGSRDTDTVILSAAGSTPVPGLVASAAYRGTASNGALSYDRGLVSQDLLGISGWGRRMNGEESVSAKLSWSGARVWRLDAAVVSTDQTRKAYHHHYSRSGWVSYVPQLDEYSEFIEGEPHPDDIFYEGPLHVPVETTESTLLYLRGSFAPSSTLDFDLRTFHSSHTSETALPNARFRDAGSLIDWWRGSITRANHQAGWFYAVQGDLPTFRWSRSRETGASLTGSYAPSDQHRLRFGLSATLGRHRLVNAVSAPIYYYGSFDEHLDSRDVTSYVEETWKSDAHSWLRVSLRQLTRKLELPGGTVERTRIAPAIAFHQPMSATDALNVEVGQTYQFPVLENSFLASTADERIPSLQVERARYVELGVQRYFTRQVTLYLGAHLREYTDVIFRENAVPDYSGILPATAATPYSLSTREFLAVLDYQLGTRLTGQSSVVIARSTAEVSAGSDYEVPWSRRAYARSWIGYKASRGFSCTLTGSWDSGSPYDFCLLDRCAPSERESGRLPSYVGLDLAGAFRRSFGKLGLEASVEIRNLLDLETPTFDFSVHPMSIGSDNFLSYWAATGDPNGYVAGEALHEQENPETRVPGRSLLVAVGVTF